MGTGEGPKRRYPCEGGGGMVWPAGEVGPAPFSQPRAAPPAQPGVKLQLQPQTAAQLSAKRFSGPRLPTQKGWQTLQRAACCAGVPGARARGRNSRENFEPSLSARG